MRYETQELLDRLAAEYVLGTLRGAARRRFERLCVSRETARAALHRWESDWSPLSTALSPVQPSASVWRNVQRRLFGASSARSPAPARRRWLLAAAAAVAAIALIVGLIVRQQTSSLQTFARLGTDPAHVLWQVERPPRLTTLTIRVVGPVQPLPGKSYELWALPPKGKPVSLGLLPLVGSGEQTLSAAQRTALIGADKLAVSVEPAGGSPTGGPTGPIIIVTPLTSVG